MTASAGDVMSLRALVLAGLLTGALVPGVHAGPIVDPAPETPARGAQLHCYDSPARLDRQLALLQAAGVTWVRLDFYWQLAEEGGPGQPSRHPDGRDYVSFMDTCVALARARGMSVLGIWLGSPRWASSDPDNPDRREVVVAPPVSAAEYARSLGWAVARYRGQVAAWEVWNEANISFFWRGDAARYAALLRAAYQAVRAADPAALVVAAGTSLADPAWAETLYANGAAASFDVVAVHPYEQPFALPPGGSRDGFAGLSAVRAVMRSHGDRRPIWLTEYGWPTGQGGVTWEQQAAYLGAAFRYVAARPELGLGPMFWYSASDWPGEAEYGIMTRDLRPKPALAALAAVS
jgi:hypothetical protein